ncbi:MAG: hypothetical protein V3R25_05885 [Nitrosomonadaceae bacterium]
MSHVYYVLNSTGGTELPLADGTLYTAEGLAEDGYSTSQFVIAFREADGTPVTPTAGTVTPLMSPIRGQQQEPGGNDKVINAIDVKADIDGTATYPLLTFLGVAEEGSVEFNGITGADHAVAYFWRA